MKVGLTYDLRQDYLDRGFGEEETAEFDSPETIEALEDVLASFGYAVERIGNIEQLAAALVAGRRWDLVFNIAEGLRGIGREAQVPALLDAYDIPYTFSDPLVAALTLDKGMTKRIIRDLGLRTPAFAVIAVPKDLVEISLHYPLFAKPLAEGTGKGVSALSKIETPEALERTVVDLLKRYKQPVLVEEYLPGREFTVGLVGTADRARVIGVMEVILLETAERNAYSFHNKENWVGLVEYEMRDDELGRRCSELSLAAWRGLGCRDGGRIDVRLDADGHPSFIEVNPLAGINPHHSDLPMLAGKVGISFPQLIRWIVDSALERVA